MVMIGAALGVAYYVKAAGAAPTPETYWWPFFWLFMLLFVTTGIGNGSTFRLVPISACSGPRRNVMHKSSRAVTPPKWSVSPSPLISDRAAAW